MHPSAAESEAYSVERHVGKDTPPMFLAQAADDPVFSAVDNSLMMFSALRTAGIPAIARGTGGGYGPPQPASILASRKPEPAPVPAPGHVEAPQR